MIQLTQGISRFFTNGLREWAGVFAILLVGILVASYTAGVGQARSLGFRAYDPVVNGAGEVESLHMSDFLIFYAAGLIAKQGQPEKTYDIELQRQVQSQLMPAKIDVVLPHLYPPQSISIFMTFAQFSPDNALKIWVICSFALLLSLMVAVRKLGLAPTTPMLLGITASLLVTGIFYVNISLGQCNILMLAGLVVAYALATQKRFLWSAFVLTFCAYKPQIFAAPVLFLMAFYGWAYVRSLLLMGVLFVLLSIPYFGIGIWFSYIEALLKVPQHLGAAYGATDMANIRALLYHFFGVENITTINTISTILWVLTNLCAAVVGWICRGNSRRVIDIGFALSIAIPCVFSPYIQFHTLILLFIPLVFMLPQIGRVTPFFMLLVIILLNAADGMAITRTVIWPLVLLSMIAGLGCLLAKNLRAENSLIT